MALAKWVLESPICGFYDMVQIREEGIVHVDKPEK
jgi:hypothetical protein